MVCCFVPRPRQLLIITWIQEAVKHFFHQTTFFAILRKIWFVGILWFPKVSSLAWYLHSIPSNFDFVSARISFALAAAASQSDLMLHLHSCRDKELSCKDKCVRVLHNTLYIYPWVELAFVLFFRKNSVPNLIKDSQHILSFRWNSLWRFSSHLTNHNKISFKLSTSFILCSGCKYEIVDVIDVQVSSRAKKSSHCIAWKILLDERWYQFWDCFGILGDSWGLALGLMTPTKSPPICTFMWRVTHSRWTNHPASLPRTVSRRGKSSPPVHIVALSDPPPEQSNKSNSPARR